ncbi:RNA polymerase sigma-70 factor (sigma-E family) [Stackebrandtia albiflava]|uniref:RNA polymerase sigma-70 factor (Sigma-E family) n=1 Tax=Stackebrandtia albiflava TaxID=406432 RepID=A0A562VAS6_9ACTN|nr:SigE family RNA polymerase sigma factor [Stackebrandtia albiflava]TWJ14989.1 RNA polymerase sigma-70 factor (sigma-E family) [Stackebrandtia albiflava]
MDDFDEYVRTAGAALLRFAFLLCGDAHRAEDLVQEALARCHRRWRAIERRAGVDTYVRKAILRQYLSWYRLRSATERVVDRFDDRGGGEDTAQRVVDRDAMVRLLADLPRRQRAVLVLRYYEDVPDDRIAELLGCAPATVRVHARRGLDGLRRNPEMSNGFPTTEVRT